MDRFAVPVTFMVTAESMEEAQEKVKQVIEHGQSLHNGDVEWVWSSASR